MKKLNVKINKQTSGSYPIIIGENVLQKAQEFIKKRTKAKKILVVTNKTILSLYPELLKLENAEFFALDDGEQYKNLHTYKNITDKALEMKLERQDAFVAFGGGVVGDITGFCAATYLRGIDFIQIPTTLLAQVDSSVGGKVAINTAFGKNLLGAFYQPKIVLADTAILDTLDNRQFKTGLAEVVKYAFIEKTAGYNFNFFKFLIKNTDKILAKDKPTLTKMIKICCEIKAKVVNKDEKETGLRAILNLGHTYAHAIEKITNYTCFTHGEAVAIGLKMIFDFAKRKKFISDEYHNKALGLLAQFGLTYDLPDNFSKEALIGAMAFDKKVTGEKIRFVVPTGKGTVKIVSDIDVNDSII